MNDSPLGIQLPASSTQALPSTLVCSVIKVAVSFEEEKKTVTDEKVGKLLQVPW